MNPEDTGLPMPTPDKERLKQLVKELLEVLEDALDVIEPYEDVSDGGDGTQRANTAMQLADPVRAARAKAQAIADPLEAALLDDGEPTYEMVQAGAKLVKDNLPYHTGTKAIYKAMRAARRTNT